MNHGLKALLLAASTIITCVVVGLGFRMAEEAKRIGNHVVEELYRYRFAIEEQDLTKYDGAKVYGGDVVNLMKKELTEKENGFCITVIRGKLEERYRTEADIRNVQDPEKAEYVVPTDEYVGKVVRDENSVITEVIFKRENREEKSDE